jgi:hypothetical protein
MSKNETPALLSELINVEELEQKIAPAPDASGYIFD